MAEIKSEILILNQSHFIQISGTNKFEMALLTLFVFVTNRYGTSLRIRRRISVF